MIRRASWSAAVLTLLLVGLLAPASGQPLGVGFPANDAEIAGDTIETLSPAAAADDTVVYITKTGKKYHRSSCRYLSKSKIKTTLKKARAQGYTPCKVCKPPR